MGKDDLINLKNEILGLFNDEERNEKEEPLNQIIKGVENSKINIDNGYELLTILIGKIRYGEEYTFMPSVFKTVEPIIKVLSKFLINEVIFKINGNKVKEIQYEVNTSKLKIFYDILSLMIHMKFDRLTTYSSDGTLLINCIVLDKETYNNEQFSSKNYLDKEFCKGAYYDREKDNDDECFNLFRDTIIEKYGIDDKMIVDIDIIEDGEDINIFYYRLDDIDMRLAFQFLKRYIDINKVIKLIKEDKMYEYEVKFFFNSLYDIYNFLMKFGVILSDNIINNKIINLIEIISTDKSTKNITLQSFVTITNDEIDSIINEAISSSYVLSPVRIFAYFLDKIVLTKPGIDNVWSIIQNRYSIDINYDNKGNNVLRLSFDNEKEIEYI